MTLTYVGPSDKPDFETIDWRQWQEPQAPPETIASLPANGLIKPAKVGPREAYVRNMLALVDRLKALEDRVAILEAVATSFPSSRERASGSIRFS